MRWRGPGLGWLLVAASLAGASAPLSAQSTRGGHGQTEQEVQTSSQTPDESGVSMEFLEFLGEWEAGDGDWVDPMEVQSADWPVITDGSSDTGDGNAN